MNLPKLQRGLGVIEGISYSIEPGYAEALVDALESIDSAIRDLMPMSEDDNLPKFWQCEWYELSEKQPTREGSYLCIGNTGTVHTSKWYTGEGSKVGAHFSNANVTHWAYLPAPPRGKIE